MAATEATPIQFIEVIDLRPFDLDTGKRVPIEPDACNRCARCGRLHAVVYIVEKDGKRYEVGATCCKYLFGWQPSHEEVKNAEAVTRDKAVRAAVEKIAQPLFEQITRKSVPAPSYVRFARGLKGYDYGFAAEGAGIWIETTDRVPRHPSQIVLLASDLERCHLTHKLAKTGLYASESCRYARITGIAPSRRRGPHDQHAVFSGKNCEKLLSGSYHRRFDAYFRPKMAVHLTLTREFEPYFDPPFPGEVMSQNGFWAILCVRKIIVGSSIHARCTGEFMSQKRRTYGIFNKRFANQWKRRQVCSWVASNYSQWPKAKQKKLEFGILDLLGLLVDAHE